MLKTTVKSLTKDKATLELADGQTLTVALDAIEGKVALGSSVSLLACVPGAEDSARQALARELINEILRP